MTENAQLALIAAVPGYLSALTALIMALVAYRQLERNSAQKAATLEVSQQVAEVKATTAQIKVATDGGFTEVKGELKTVTDQNKTLTEQNASLHGTVKVLSDAIAARPGETKRETGEIIKEVKNGNGYADLLKKVTELTALMAGYGEKGMPVVAPEGESLPVKVVEVVSKK